MAAQGGLVTYESSVTSAMVTVREEAVGLFDHLSLSCHKHIFSLLMTGSVIFLLKLLLFPLCKENCRGIFHSRR